ncbi:hypothetical protein RFI_05078 [Reticulomyxa filosa]|uniref:Uncharacterized protein n=1 Tax=Reticulomyxa filosa TaxID=46433 RepID=X6P1B8_RETFI|nr:hypothetical protein RFI_05078 [Reticulomyxa filosa]|eukprot:ETO32041.1 hypothetical protein RFI_05078 [Reticulomyxa filosa]
MVLCGVLTIQHLTIVNSFILDHVVKVSVCRIFDPVNKIKCSMDMEIGLYLLSNRNQVMLAYVMVRERSNLEGTKLNIFVKTAASEQKGKNEIKESSTFEGEIFKNKTPPYKIISLKIHVSKTFCKKKKSKKVKNNRGHIYNTNPLQKKNKKTQRCNTMEA